MKKTKFSDFQAELRATGAYRTAEDHRAPKRAKAGALTTFRFSWGVVSVFPKTGLCRAFGRLTCKKWEELCFSSVSTPEKLGMNVIVEGFETLRDLQEPAVLLSNHMSTTETVLLPPIIRAFRPFSYVAKASLAHLPGLEKAAAEMRMVPIGRVSPREDLMNILKVGTERIRTDGDHFLIFPQGTRCEVFSSKKFSSIGAKLAERASAPIVPIVVDTRSQPTRKTGFLKKVFKDLGPVDTSIDIRVACGPVIPAGKSKDMQAAAFEWMANKLEAWGLPVER